MRGLPELLTLRVLEFLMDTLQLMEKRSVLLATLLAMAFGKGLFTKTKNVAKDRNHLTETKFP